MNKIYNFYVLSASSDEQNIRYVGVTTRSIIERFYGHKYCAKHKNKRGLPVHKWMFSHYSKGETIIVKQIDKCDSNEWEDREKYWIKYYKDKGFNLLNVSEGGNGVVTKEMRSESSINRSIQGHKKAIIALNMDGTFYKEFDSAIEATKELNIKSKSSINNVLKGRSKSSAGYMWVYKENYNSNNIYKYNKVEKGIKIYQFDINGSFIQEYPSIRNINSIEGFSSNGLRSALKEKRLYHNCYWSKTKTIDIDEFEPYYKYVELSNNNDIVELYHDQIEISNKFNINTSTVCTKIKEQKIFPGGNIIRKL